VEFATDRLAAVFQDDGVRLATLFGSAMSSPTPRDVDVAVLFDSYHMDRYLALQVLIGSWIIRLSTGPWPMSWPILTSLPARCKGI